MTDSGFTPAEEAINRLFRIWQKRLGLEDWRIIIHVDPLNKEKNKAWKMATFHGMPNLEAKIFVNPKLLDPDICRANNIWIEKTVVHELLHCVIKPLSLMGHVVEKMRKPSHQTEMLLVAKAAHEQAEEGAVDRLAIALVRSWPRSEEVDTVVRAIHATS
jgi:hypothetical protein